MQKDELIQTARSLAQPSSSAALEYSRKREALAAEINGVMSKRQDLDALIGSGNLAMMEDNHRNHARFMESMFTAYDPAVLVSTVLWVFRAYRAHGFRLAYWPAQLDTWIEILRADLSEEAFKEIYPFYNWMLINQEAFTELSESWNSRTPRTSATSTPTPS